MWDRGLARHGSARVRAVPNDTQALCGIEGEEPRMWQVDAVGTIGGIPADATAFACVNLEILWTLGGRQFSQRVDVVPSSRIRFVADSVLCQASLDTRRVERIESLPGGGAPWGEATIAASIAPATAGGEAWAWYADPVAIDVQEVGSQTSIHPLPIMPAGLDARLIDGPPAAANITGTLAQIVGNEVTGIGEIDGTSSMWPDAQDIAALYWAPIPSYATHLGLTANDPAWISGGGQQRFLMWRLRS